MKKSSLSLAIFMALGVIACGGSDGGTDQTVPNNGNATPTPDPAPKPEQPSTPDSTLVDPTQTHVVDNRDLLKESTVGTLQYIRREGSEYDRIFNPSQRASSTPLLGVSLDEQNPKLTNIVLARQELERPGGVPVKAQFAGGMSPEPLTREGRPQSMDSLQVENYQNVDILAGAFKQFGSAAAHTDGTPIDSHPTGEKFDYDTHIEDNLDAAGEHTRKRVSHNYTIRYEYKQPYVDFPNAVDPANNINKEWKDDSKLPETRAPVAPRHDGLGWMEANLKRDQVDGKWWIDEDANIHSRHPVNIGTGSLGIGGGSIANNIARYGNFDAGMAGTQDAAKNWAHHDRWRNIGFNPDVPGAFLPVPTKDFANNRGDHWIAPLNDADRTKKWLVDWASPPFNGSINRGGSCHTSIGECGVNNEAIWSNQTYDYRTYVYPWYPDLAATYSYRTIYPDWTRSRISGYPAGRHKYDESRNNAIRDGIPINGVTDGGQPRNHQHIYLEQEEFSAIRTHEPIRPLKNPIPHEWKWELFQTWHSYYPLKVEREYEVTDPVTGAKTKEWRLAGWAMTADPEVDFGKGEIFHTKGLATRHTSGSYGGKFRNETGVGECKGEYRCTYDRRASDLTQPGNPNLNYVVTNNLVTSRWENPKNQYGGETGEFRGPWYVGWDDDNRTVRFNDERIWKPGTAGYKPEYERKYGANLIWWSTQDSAFENYATAEGVNPRARRVDVNTTKNPAGLSEDLVWAQGTDNGTNARDKDVEIQPSGDITNGLIRIGGGLPTLGEELQWDNTAKVWKDHHNTTSRIFGRYHLAWSDGGTIKPVSLNSYQNARSFVSRVSQTLGASGKNPHSQQTEGMPQPQLLHADLESKPLLYSIGANPMTLTKVQYGRVTTNLDLEEGEGPYEDGFLRSPFAYKNSGTAVDNYFYRGIEATTIEQMKSVTASNGSARYEGHALMYGIDNSYKGIKEIGQQSDTKAPLPNAFSIPDTGGAGDLTGYSNTLGGSLGFGNFVQADVNFGTKKITGEVYNAWLLNQSDNAITKDLKVHFKGDVIGNTVIGTADRVYVTGDDKADFRASFFGAQAEEMGGSFNSVTRQEKYGSAYEQNDWGGVFGAKKVGSGNTFQGDDGANVYSGQ